LLLAFLNVPSDRLNTKKTNIVSCETFESASRLNFSQTFLTFYCQHMVVKIGKILCAKLRVFHKITFVNSYSICTGCTMQQWSCRRRQIKLHGAP